ncbi:MAG TPA: hypothetical protein VNV18_06645 [Stellaceae bacterium]|jgi:hypothetical protein|nr:hypothetical protein [Stellaceae bacterium]
MSSLTITATVLCCVVAGAALGMWLGYRLPEPHRSAQSHDAIKLATGMLSVLAALVLGLLIASVKNAFDTTDSQIRHFSATLILLNQTLADYGPETADARDMLRHYTDRALADNWPADKATPVKMEDADAGKLLDGVRTSVLVLPADDPRHAALRSEAESLVADALKTRWVLIERAESSIQPLFLEILIAWITLIFVSFGYNAPRNATVMASFLFSAAALAACIFLIVEMDTPFEGLITVSSTPMRDALAHMGQQPEVSALIR